MEGIFLDGGCFDKVISIHEIKLIPTGETVKKTLHFWPWNWPSGSVI